MSDNLLKALHENGARVTPGWNDGRGDAAGVRCATLSADQGL